ncbi:MAG: efflux RND transporter periplasmic adaptor subunit [Candidatus Riflebacteria bacterium]|nr:efflux RND transporter periplasmic adaptor subunit [Candidatus Riflebacteria bacterium]
MTPMARVMAAAGFLLLAAAGQPSTERSVATGSISSPPASPADLAMCREHHVPEAVCTKCHPKLEAIFRMKRDWCEKHGFPESVCPTCRPGGAARTAELLAGLTEDTAPAHGTKVRLRNADVARLAGLQTALAISRTAAPEVSAVARIVPDATRVTHVHARAAGVLKSLLVDVGSKVQAGAPLAVIQSASVGSDRSRSEAARARLAVAEATHRRERELAAQGISAHKDVLAAGQELAAARAELASAASALAAVSGDVQRDGSHHLTSPIQGIVTRRRVMIGEVVDTSTALFEVIDTSAVWAELDVPESDLDRVREGNPVKIEVDILPGRTFSGTLTYLAPEVDEKTRTVRGRVALANADRVLRANMFGQARVETGPGRRVVVVPSHALQRARDVRLVFVRLAEDSYETRRVEVGSDDGQTVEILEGVRAGETVVTTGSFLLKTETLKESIGAGCCEVEAPRKK